MSLQNSTDSSSIFPIWRVGMGKMVPGFLIFLLLFVVPAAIILTYSLLSRGEYGGVVWQLDFDSYARVFGFPNENELRDWDFVYLGIFAKSACIASLTAFLALLAGYPVAWYIARQNEKTKYALLFLVTLPFFANALVRVYSWMLILRSDGLINNILLSLDIIQKPLTLLYTPGAVVVAMLYQYLPFMVLPLFASIEKLDLRLIEVSQDLGASATRTFFRVILPQTKPGIVAGLVLVFVPSLGNFVAPTMIGGGKDLQVGPLLEQAFLDARDWPFGSAVATVLSTLVLICLIIMSRIERKAKG